MALVGVGSVVGAADWAREWRTGSGTVAGRLVVLADHAAAVGAVVGLAQDVVDGRAPPVGLVGGERVHALQVVQVQAEQVAVVDGVPALGVLVEQQDVGVVGLDVVGAGRRVGLVEAGDEDVRVEQLLVALDDALDAQQGLVVGGGRALAGSVLEEHLLDSGRHHQAGQIVGPPGQVLATQLGERPASLGARSQPDDAGRRERAC